MDQTDLTNQFRLANRHSHDPFPQHTGIKLRQKQHSQAGLNQSDLGFLLGALASNARFKTGSAAGLDRLLLGLASLDNKWIFFQLLKTDVLLTGERMVCRQHGIKRLIPDLLHFEQLVIGGEFEEPQFRGSIFHQRRDA